MVFYADFLKNTAIIEIYLYICTLLYKNEKLFFGELNSGNIYLKYNKLSNIWNLKEFFTY